MKLQHADREYIKGAFQAFCRDKEITLMGLAAEDNEANGLVERGNRALRSVFRRLRAEKSKDPLSVIIPEATYARNICKGSKRASSFELPEASNHVRFGFCGWNIRNSGQTREGYC